MADRRLVSSALFLFLIDEPQAQGNTLVYNLKIRRAFSVDAVVGKHKPRAYWALSALPVVYNRKRQYASESITLPTFSSPGVTRSENDFMAGSLFNIRYIDKHHWWLELTTGIEKETLKAHGKPSVDYSRTGLDDIVISGGYNLFFGHNTQLVFFGLAGFPSTRKISPPDISDTLVGTRFLSAGLGTELSYALINTPEQHLIGLVQARFIHFFSRTYSPVLPQNGKIVPGNITDVLFTAQYRRGKNVFETGYNPTFFTNEGIEIGTTSLHTHNFLRNSIYLNIAHIFGNIKAGRSVFLLGIGCNVGWSPMYETRIRDG